MAHESRLTAFEQALKDEGIKGTNLEPVARSIFQQESSSGANVKTSNAGARGPMQVLPATFKAYNPQGNIDNPYDNSVGGLRYIKDLFNQTKDLGLTAVGYYGGPKAIEKARQGVAVRDPRNPNAPDTLQYREQVMGRTKETPAAKPTPATKPTRPAVPKIVQEAAPELGPNYQAALALMAKADDLSEAREKIAEEDELAADADFSQAKKMLAQIQPVTGFAAQEPRRMADGGFVGIPNIQTPTLSAKDKARRTELETQLKKYDADIKSYNDALEKYNTEIYNPYKTKTEEYNRAAEEYNKLPVQQYGGSYVVGSGASAGRYYDRNYYNRGGGMYIPRAPVAGDYLGDVNQYNTFTIKPGYYFENGYIKGKPGFTLTAPTAPDPFNMTAPTAPTTQEEIDKFITQAQATAQRNATGRQVARNAVEDPSRYNFGSVALGGLSGFGGTSTQLFAEGGEAKKASPSTGETIKGTAKEILRSMQYAPYDLLGAPVDIGNLALKGVDYVTGSKLATDKPVGGSEYLIQKSRELGIADEPTGSTTETLTRLGTGILSPTAGPRAVIAAGKAAKGTAKAALEDLAMAGTGQGGSKLAQKIMEPGTAFAVRPKGGVFLGAKSVDEPPLSNFDIQLRHFTENLDRTDPQQAEVVNFLDKKFRNYVMKDLGTADDPVFKKMISGEIPNYTYATTEEVAAARAGDPAAIKKVRDAYDSSLFMNFYVGEKQATELGKGSAYRYIRDLENKVKKQIKEQSPTSPSELMTSGNKLSEQEIEKYGSLYGAPGFKQFVQESEAGSLLRMLNKTDLPPHIRRAIAEGEPVFAQAGSIRGSLDITELRDYLLTRNPNDIKNMGVADAIAKSKQWHAQMEAARRDPSKFSPKQLFEGTKEMLPTADSMKWVDVKTPDALSLEGNIMGHCVGGSNYCNAVAKETTKIVSLRDKKGIPHVTIEIQKDRDGKFSRIAQIKGTGNNSPEKYFTQVDDFLKDYSSKLGGDLSITERPNYVPPDWRYK